MIAQIAATLVQLKLLYQHFYSADLSHNYAEIVNINPQVSSNIFDKYEERLSTKKIYLFPCTRKIYEWYGSVGGRHLREDKANNNISHLHKSSTSLRH